MKSKYISLYDFGFERLNKFEKCVSTYWDEFSFILFSALFMLDIKNMLAWY